MITDKIYAFSNLLKYSLTFIVLFLQKTYFENWYKPYNFKKIGSMSNYFNGKRSSFWEILTFESLKTGFQLDLVEKKVHFM